MYFFGFIYKAKLCVKWEKLDNVKHREAYWWPVVMDTIPAPTILSCIFKFNFLTTSPEWYHLYVIV